MADQARNCNHGCQHLDSISLLRWHCARRYVVADAEGIYIRSGEPLATLDDKPLRTARCLEAGLTEGCKEVREDG